MAITLSMITITVVALRQTATRGGVGTASRLGASAALPGDSPSAAVPVVTSGWNQPPAGFALSKGLLDSLRKGDCLLWTPIAANSTAPPEPVTPVRVGCDRPHIDEVTRLVDLAPLFVRWPGASTLAKAAGQRCAGALRDYVGAIDSTPHHVVGTVYPSEPSWQSGARTAVCTVRTDDLAVRSGAFRSLGPIGA
ncbi:septum formation family protein [Frankia sp. AgB32]|uniref:septum formation family protein n=1 Tax=Frankia sp. AgB32 TaxID=631119 RepID=UPI00200E4283|nr:septum formation family protein [Frankia sp. AgB32]MCK9894686.1 septum formation family protein [Frankia sp. AgB32]